MYLENLVIGTLVFGLSVWMTGQLSSDGARVRLMDHPNERSLHATPIPRTGGLAILFSLALGLLLEILLAMFGVRSHLLEAKTSIWVIGVTLLLAAVSLWDDWGELSPGFRFVLHGLAAVAVVFGAGLTIDSLPLPLVRVWSLGWASLPLSVLCLMWMTNLYNFMDGMDGFAGGMSIVGFGFLGLIALGAGNMFIALLSFLIVAAVAGFLIYNWPPAKIFMGDVGSILLGFLAGALSIMGVHEKLFDLWVPVLIFSPFIVDATVTLFRRLVRGERVWLAHREHYYQRLVLLGWGHRKTVLAEYCLMLACGTSAVIYTRTGERVRFVLLVLWVLLYCALAVSVRLAEQRSKLALRQQEQA
jgi:UDP-N-acetylmuramyl pentapeptide phosphotransferase/UDP-N-acetylglucosamine-1-phosphate transferase